MNFSKVLIANAIFAAIGGLGLLTMPVEFIEPYGVTLNSGGIFLAQILAFVLFGIAVLNYQLRNIKEKNVFQALSLMGIIAHGGSVAIGAYANFSGVMNGLVWVDVIIHALLLLGFWYYGLNKSK
jgi:hypothetical protein